MGSETSKPPPPPITTTLRPQPLRSRNLEPWRLTERETFEETEQFLKDDLKRYREFPLKIFFVGHIGAGTSSVINSLFCISRNRLVDVVSTRDDGLPGYGTMKFEAVRRKPGDIFGKIRIFDTMGFSTNRDAGISDEDFQALCQGRIKNGHKFNVDAVETATCHKNKPHCIAFVVSAEVLHFTNESDAMSMWKQKFLKLHDIVPDDVSQIAIITKCDRVCEDTVRDIENIYKSPTICTLVKMTERMFGIEQNKVFPIVNYRTELFPNPKKNLPILSALISAVHFAYDRASQDSDGNTDSEVEGF